MKNCDDILFRLVKEQIIKPILPILSFLGDGEMMLKNQMKSNIE